MEYEWDEAKRQANIEKHLIDFSAALHFEWEDATIFEDTRKNYQERRFVAYGYIHQRLVAMVYTMRGDTVRIISLRKANQREVKRYG